MYNSIPFFLRLLAVRLSLNMKNLICYRVPLVENEDVPTQVAEMLDEIVPVQPTPENEPTSEDQMCNIGCFTHLFKFLCRRMHRG